jgi:UPF0271 protein
VTVFLNVDAGELADEPSALYALADVVSVAGGGHAGDEASVRLAVGHAKSFGTRLGAHPSYDDRAGFGRRALVVPLAELAESVCRQCALVKRAGDEIELWVEYVKPHGALYHAANRDHALAECVLAAAQQALGNVVVIGPPTGALRDVATSLGLGFAAEGFADRAYDENGQLVPRAEPGAVLSSPAEAVAQALRLARAGEVDTLCLHGDSPGAPALLAAVRAALDEAALLVPRPALP